MREVKRLVGIHEIKTEIDSICRNEKRYKTLNIKPPHLLIHLDSANGRSAVTDYITDMFVNYGIIDFSLARNENIEIEFDGSLQQFRAAWAEIQDAADFSNEYGNILCESGLDNLAQHLNEQQIDEFYKHLEVISNSAFLIMFVSSRPNKNEVKLISKVKEIVTNLKEISISSYSIQDYCDVIVSRLNEYGVQIDNREKVMSILQSLIENENIHNMKQAISLADRCMQFVNVDCEKPTLFYEELNNMYEDNNAKSGGEMK